MHSLLSVNRLCRKIETSVILKEVTEKLDVISEQCIEIVVVNSSAKSCLRMNKYFVSSSLYEVNDELVENIGVQVGFRLKLLVLKCSYEDDLDKSNLPSKLLAIVC